MIGAQRAGTTSLHHYLAGHPDLRPPRATKGVHWFDTGWTKPMSWYAAHFETDRGAGISFESSPYYLFHPEVPQRVADTLADVRVVAVLRDPVARAWSAFHHETAKGYEHLDFDDALAAEHERLDGAESALAGDPTLVHDHHLHHGYLARGRYAEQLARWHAAIGPDRVHVVDSDDLRREPQLVCDDIARFLGRTPTPLELSVAHNTRAYPALDPDRRAALREHFTASDRELEIMLGRTFSWMVPPP